MAFQSITADRPLSDPLRDLPRSALPRLCRRSSSERDHHRWGVETCGLRYSCGGEVAPWSWEAGDVSSNQPGLWPLPGHPLLPRHGETKQLFYISINALNMYLFKVVFCFFYSFYWNILCVTFLGTLWGPDLFPSWCEVLWTVWCWHGNCPARSQREHQATASQLSRPGTGLQRLCNQFHHRIRQEGTTVLPLLSFTCKRQKQSLFFLAEIPTIKLLSATYLHK